MDWIHASASVSNTAMSRQKCGSDAAITAQKHLRAVHLVLPDKLLDPSQGSAG